MNYPKLTHELCQDTHCRLCLREHLALGDYLVNRCKTRKEDFLGLYHWFVGKNKTMIRDGVVQETVYGWADILQFKPKYLELFIDWYLATSGDRCLAEEWECKS